MMASRLAGKVWCGENPGQRARRNAAHGDYVDHTPHAQPCPGRRSPGPPSVLRAPRAGASRGALRGETQAGPLLRRGVCGARQARTPHVHPLAAERRAGPAFPRACTCGALACKRAHPQPRTDTCAPAGAGAGAGGAHLLPHARRGPVGRSKGRRGGPRQLEVTFVPFFFPSRCSARGNAQKEGCYLHPSDGAVQQRAGSKCSMGTLAAARTFKRRRQHPGALPSGAVCEARLRAGRGAPARRRLGAAAVRTSHSRSGSGKLW